MGKKREEGWGGGGGWGEGHGSKIFQSSQQSLQYCTFYTANACMITLLNHTIHCMYIIMY